MHPLIHASLELEDGLITRHTDRFDLEIWIHMTSGSTGYLLDPTPMMRSAIRPQAIASLDRRPETQDLLELNR